MGCNDLEVQNCLYYNLPDKTGAPTLQHHQITNYSGIVCNQRYCPVFNQEWANEVFISLVLLLLGLIL